MIGLWPFEPCNMIEAKTIERIWVQCCPRFGNCKGNRHYFASFVVFLPNDRDFDDVWMLKQHLLHLAWIDIGNP